MKKVLKKIYTIIPFKQQFFFVIKSVFKIPHSIHRHLYFNGIISFKVNGKKILMHQKGHDVENTLFWGGVDNCWEKISIGLWIKLCQKFNNICDIGANTGAYALIAKSINPTADVMAFEPLDFIFNKLKKNVDLNKMDIKCFKTALSDFDGEAKVYAESLEHLYSVTVNKNHSGTDTKVFETTINAKRISTLVMEGSVQKIDLMKIDVETHEFEVLSGMGGYLEKWRPTMLIEILTDEVGANVEKLIKDMGYLYFNINENGGIRRVDTIGKSDYYNYLICSPAIAEYLKL